MKVNTKINHGLLKVKPIKKGRAGQETTAATSEAARRLDVSR